MAIPQQLKATAKADVQHQIYKGAFGEIPIGRCRKRDLDKGGFYFRIDEYTKPKYGDNLGRGTITKMKNEVLQMQGKL